MIREDQNHRVQAGLEAAQGLAQTHVAQFVSGTADHVSNYVQQRIGSSELAKLVPLKNEQLDGDDDAFFSYTGPDVSDGMVHLLCPVSSPW